MSMDGLRKGASNLNSGKGKGAVRSAFRARWKPPQMVVGVGTGKNRTTLDLKPFLAAAPHEESKIEAAEPVVLIPGQYSDVYAVDETSGARIDPPPVREALHFRVHNFNVWMKPRNPQERGYNTFRELICSQGPDPHVPQPCVGCYQGDHGADKSTRARDQWAFNMAHLAWYHMIPFVKDNQVQMKKDGSGPVMLKEECRNHKPENVYLGRAIQAGRAHGEIAKRFKPCDGCQNQAQWVWGEHRVLQLGFKHLKNLFEIDDTVGKRCINCNTGIIRIAFDCEQCGNEMLNLSQVQWTNDQIEQYSKTQQQCSCGHVGLPKSGYECGFDENFNQVAQACDNPQRTTIFDCVLWLQREGESTESEVVVKRVELISRYQTQDGRPLAEHLKEIVKEPFNLAEMYKPEDLNDQAENIRVDNPYAQQQQQYAGYGGGQSQPGPGYQPPGGPGGYAPPQNSYQPPGGPQPGPGPQYGPPGGRPNYGR
jgi:hypothetical protein